MAPQGAIYNHSAPVYNRSQKTVPYGAIIFNDRPGIHWRRTEWLNIAISLYHIFSNVNKKTSKSPCDEGPLTKNWFSRDNLMLPR